MKKLIVMVLVAMSLGAMVFAQFAEKPPSGSRLVDLSEDMPDGRVDVMVTQRDDLRITLEVSLVATASIDLSQLQPVAVLAMEAMHMDGVSPTLASRREGVWIGEATLPMSGEWVMSIGFGEEFIETAFEVQ
tara:strand:+ start:805 stop:1200 length:396 start_codon:yes stop_codon:yes gene_type:complete